MTIRIGVVGGSPAWRRGVAVTLEEAGYETTSFASMSDWKPGAGGSAIVAFFDPNSPAEEFQRQSELHPLIPLLAVVEAPTVALTAKLLRFGANTVLDEEDETYAFPKAVETAMQGKTLLPTVVARSMAQTVPSSQDMSDWLTDAEAAWLRAMARGQTVGEIANNLGYSERALFRMLRGLYIRLGVRNRTEALVWASRHGVLTEPDEAS